MKTLVGIILFLMKISATRSLVKGAQNQSAVFYLKALKIVHQSLFGAILIFSFLQLMVFSLIGAISLGVYLLPLETVTKVWILFGLFGIVFLVSFFMVTMLLSERRWVQMSGVDKLIDQ